MSEEKNEINDVIKEASLGNEDKNITIKKSTYNGFIKGTVIAIAVATFFAGFSLGTNIQNSEPEITKEDFNALMQQIEKQGTTSPSQPAQQKTQPSQPQIIDVSIDDDPFKGSQDAPITIVEFSDFQCPFCSRFFQQTLPQLEQNYIVTGKVKFVYRDLPLDSLHPNARPTHIAAECADEQGKFWQYHDILFENQTQWNKLASKDLDDTLVQYAQDLGLDVSSFKACLNSPEIADEVNKDYLEATRYGVSGTPTFFIGNEKDGFTKLVGAQPFTAFESQIESRLG
jgi:protein-disulfide isomerase